MRSTGSFLLFLLCLFLIPPDRVALSARASGSSKMADRPLKDELRDDVERQVQRLVVALQENLENSFSDRSAWYDRYAELARQTEDNSVMVDELLNISRVALPVIWYNFAASMMEQRLTYLRENGHEENFDTVHTPRKHPILNLPTQLRPSDDFTIEFVLSLRKEANIALRLHLLNDNSPRDLDWDNGDILAAVHFRRTYHTGDEKRIVMNDRYNNAWGPNAVMNYPDTWPDIRPHEKIRIIIIKLDNCFTMRVLPGEDQLLLLLQTLPHVFTFCYSKEPYSPALERLKDNPKIILSVNEDEVYDGREVVDVHRIVHYPEALYL